MTNKWATMVGEGKVVHTSQPVNGPLLKLLERYVGSGRRGIEIQTMRVLGLLVSRVRELLLAVVEDVSPLRINAVEILSLHPGQYIRLTSPLLTYAVLFGGVKSRGGW
jgi:hypothetical protein